MNKPDMLSFLSYLAAAAILLPVAWWVDVNFAKQIGHFVLSLGGLLY